MVKVIFLSLYNKGECRIRISILRWEHVSKFSSRKEEEYRRQLKSRNFGNTAADENVWWLADPLKAGAAK